MITSRDATPAIKQDEDDPVFLYTNNHRQDLQPYETSQFLTPFIERPTLKNARRVLRSYNIHEPLKTLANNNHLKSTLTAGGHLNKDAIRELVFYDTLHDLQGPYNTPPTPQQTLEMFSKHITDMPRRLKTLFLTNGHEFTRETYEYLRVKLGVHTFAYRTPDVANIDRALFLRFKNLKSIEIVLDNVVANLRYDSTVSQNTIAYISFAYILCLCTNLSRYMPQLASQPVLLYDGLFLKIDGTYVNRFMVLFTKSMKRCTKAPIVKIQPLYGLQPVLLNKALGTNIKCIETQDGVQEIVFNNKTYKVEYAPASVDTITFPHSKTRFREHVHKHRDEDLWYLNFLRDAFKADVAVQKDCLYMTHDRLAYLFYRAIGGKKGVLLVCHDQTRQYDLIV